MLLLQVEVLRYMQTKCDAEGRFGADFLKEFKAYLEGNPALKSETKVGPRSASVYTVIVQLTRSILTTTITEPDAVRRVYA